MFALGHRKELLDILAPYAHGMRNEM
jgi:hypothetical protein